MRGGWGRTGEGPGGENFPYPVSTCFSLHMYALIGLCPFCYLSVGCFLAKSAQLIHMCRKGGHRISENPPRPALLPGFLPAPNCFGDVKIANSFLGVILV